MSFQAIAARLPDGNEQNLRQEVGVETRQVLGGAHVEDGPAVQPPCAEGVAVPDVVVRHVDAAIAVLWEVRVSHPARTGHRRPHGHRGSGLQRPGQRQPKQGRDEPGSEDRAGNLRHRWGRSTRAGFNRLPLPVSAPHHGRDTGELPGAPREEARP